MSDPLFPTALPTRQGFTFYDPANPGNSYSTPLNPVTVKKTPGNVRKWTATTNGTAGILGQSEYPPKMIQLEWPQLDKSIYDTIRAFCGIAPIVMVDNNDQGYLGVLVCDTPDQLSGVSKSVWHCVFSFLVIAPYNGLSTTINKLAIPTISTGTSSTGGYIPRSYTMYIFPTICTPWGESSPGPTITAATGGTTDTNTYTLSFTAPTSSDYRKLRLYWNSTNNPLTATWLTDIWSGMSPTFTFFVQYFQVSQLNPPTYGRNFTGKFQGGLWVNGT